MTRLKRGIGGAVAALALVAFTAHADEREKTGQKMAETAVKKLEYVNDVALLDEGQIALGKLALEKSQDPQVQQFAQQLVNDHQRHLDNLRDWAQSRGIEVAEVYLRSDTMAVGGSGLSEKTQEKLGEEAQKANERIDKKTSEIRSNIEKLQAKTGSDFDKSFLSQVVDDQKKGERLMRDGLKEYKGDVSFSMILNQTQPVLQRHVDDAKSIEKRLKG